MSFFADFDLTKTFYLNLSNQLDISHPIYGVLFTVSKFHDNYNVTLSEYLSSDASFSLCIINETAVHSNLNNHPLIGNYYLKVYNTLIDVSDIYIYDPSYCTVGHLLDISFDEIESGEISTQYIIDSINTLCPDLKIIQGINPLPATHIPTSVPLTPIVTTPLTYFSEEQMLAYNPTMNTLPQPVIDTSFTLLLDTSSVVMDVSKVFLYVTTTPMDVSGMVGVDVSNVVTYLPGVVVNISGTIVDASGVLYDASGVEVDLSGVAINITALIDDIFGIELEISGIRVDISGVTYDISGIDVDVGVDIDVSGDLLDTH
jgi:hypothetical protein